MDQSLVEVLEEEELKALRSQREAFIEERNQAIAESQKLEAESQRRFEERERRLEQERDRLVNEQIVAHKIASRQTSAQFLQGLNNQVIDKLSATGHFYDPVQDQVENSFLPWLLESVYSSLKEHELVQQQVDQVITSALSAMTTQLANQDAVQAKAAADQVAAQETFEQEVIAVQSQIDAEAAKKAEYDRLVAERNARVEARAAAEAQRLEELENQSVEEQDEDATDDDTMTENTETDTETDYTDGSYTDTTA
jgi:hypothetical protein